MQQKQPETWLPPTPPVKRRTFFGVPMVERQVGWGYIIGCLALWVSAVAALFSGSLGLFIAAIGGGFVFGIVYTLVRGLGVNWTVGRWQNVRYGTLTGDRNPVLYWSLLGGMLVLACGLVGLGIWMRLRGL